MTRPLFALAGPALAGPALAALCLAAPMAAAQQQPYGGYKTAIFGGTSKVMPPADHAGQWWTHPSGCEYSRTGRPGEVVWYLIINTARPECPTYIAIRGGRDIY
ncbi:MAG: hypothetical protein IBX58_13355 [Roseovarius sp.]|nr:hypothetical protein [Roseovarius sp.]